MTIEEEKLAKEARQYIKNRKREIIKKISDPAVYPKTEHPISIFMAGSPGAGKTEFSRRLNKVFELPIVRIDADEIRDQLPGYNGKNSYVFQGAVSLGVDKILDSCLHNEQPFVLDGTLCRLDKSLENIERCVKRKRPVIIMYIYQDPKIAWEFTQKREIIEGRNIPKEAFIESFIKSREVVNEIKNRYGEKVRVTAVKKDFKNKDERIWASVDNIDKVLTDHYTVQMLKELLV